MLYFFYHSTADDPMAISLANDDAYELVEKICEKTLDKSLIPCYNKDTPRGKELILWQF